MRFGWSREGTRLYERRVGAFDIGGLTISLCGVMVGLLLVLDAGSAATLRKTCSNLSNMMANYNGKTEVAPLEALVITGSPNNELTLVTALSPRGYHPSLAGSQAQVLAQLEARGKSVNLVVVDSGVADYAAISRAVRGALPQARVIVIQGELRAEDIGPALLDQL